MKRMMRHLFAVMLLCFGLVPVASAVDEVFVTGDGAVRGYDVVAYHLDHEAKKGSTTISHDWNGATWHFTTEAHRDAFAADPARYAPKYGGYCAYGLANGYKVGTDPDAFTIGDGVLDLNYSLAVQRTWRRARDKYIAIADVNWMTLAAAKYE